MRNLQIYAEEGMHILDDLNIPYNKSVRFVVNTKAKKRWGQCKPVIGGYEININKILLDERNSADGLMDTIVHELLHTCHGCCNHGPQWKRYADIVNRAYGYRIKRTSSADDKGVVAGVQERTRVVKHKLVCTKCGQEVLRSRTSKFVMNPEMYSCGICGGKFKRIF